MIDHSENTLGAAIKALRFTVAPAVDPGDAQAVEQLRLTIDFLDFLRVRLYDLHARHRYELTHQVNVARALADDAKLVSEQADLRLQAALRTAGDVIGDEDAQTGDLRAASKVLWAAVRGTIRESRQAPDEVRRRIEASVVRMIDPLVTMESAWYLPFGFEPDPASVPGLGELFGRE